MNDPRDERIRKAEALYQSTLRASLEPAHIGRFIAIDPESGTYGLGDEALEACLAAQQKGPQGKLVSLRIGYPATRFVGARL